MKIIHEIPYTFRITLVREVLQHKPLFPGTYVEVRETPFLINYRAPGAESAEHCELTDELFSVFLSVTPENQAMYDALIKYLPPQFAMSEGMRKHLLEAPKELLSYCVLKSEKPVPA